MESLRNSFYIEVYQLQRQGILIKRNYRRFSPCDKNVTTSLQYVLSQVCDITLWREYWIKLAVLLKKRIKLQAKYILLYKVQDAK